MCAVTTTGSKCSNPLVIFLQKAAQKYLNRLKVKGGEQKVYVLKDGFFGWQVSILAEFTHCQARYGNDKALTEGWDKDFWEFYM